jgi:hypothetical protein
MNRRLVLILLPAVFFAVGGSSAQPVEQEKLASAPRLIWEKEFPVRHISAVGVDAEYYARSGDIEGSLKWLLSYPYMYRIWWRGRALVGPALGYVYESLVSPSSNRFIALLPVPPLRRWHRWRAPWGGFYCRAVRPGGLDGWILKSNTPIYPALIRDDGSAVLGSGWDGIRGFYFVDHRGLVRGMYELEYSRPASLLPGNISQNYFAFGDYSSEMNAEVCLFDRDGKLLWKRDVGRGWVEVAVSDSGDVLATLDRFELGNAVALVLDREGAVRDSVPLRLTGIARSPKADEGLAFDLTHGLRGHAPWVDGDFLCYDFGAGRARFLLNAEDDYRFTDFSANTRIRHVAVLKRFYGRVPTSRRPDGAIAVYDFDGQHKTEVSVRLSAVGEHPVWFKLLDGALLVTDGNKLKLYEIDVE